MNYGGIYKASLADGIGWRVVLFVSGCNHKCAGCHNAELWDKNSGKLFTNDTLNTIIKALDKSEINGLTLSGGDPLMEYNITEIEELCKLVKVLFPQKTIWLYTGYEWESIKDLDIMNYIDVLVDGKFLSDKKDTTIAFRGSTNQRIIDVVQSKKQNKTVELQY